MPRILILPLVVALALLLAGAGPARAMDEVRTRGMIEGVELTILIRETLAALDHANRTGNYTVLRDIAAPSFRTLNDAADLAHTFAPFRAAGIDMAPVLVAAPSLTSHPMMDQAGRLHLVGYVATKPQKIRYRLIFARAGVRWRLDGLAVRLDDETDPALLAGAALELRRLP